MTKLPTPRKFQDELEELQRLSRRGVELRKAYELAHSLAYDERRGGDGSTPLGSTTLRPDGSVTGYVPETAVESARADAYRSICREMARFVAEATVSLGAALSIIDRKKNRHLMGEQFSQIAKPSRDSVLRPSKPGQPGELDESIAAKGRREERGEGVG